MPTITDEQVADHPLTVYRKAHNEARDLLQAELDKQTTISQKSADDAVAAAANAAALTLTSNLSLFEAKHDRFLVTVMTTSIGSGPGADVVQETEMLARKLAEVVVKRDAVALAVRAVTQYLSGAIAVFNGTVSATPPASPAN